MLTLSMSILHLFVCALVAIARDDAASWLSKLDAADSFARAQAQKWLAAHLEPSDFDAVLARASTGDAEVRARLVEALSADDRHLGLAARLATSTDDNAARTGRASIAEANERWNPGSDRMGMTGPELWSELGGKDKPEMPIAIDADLAAGPFEDVVDLVARFAARVPEIVIDPDFGPPVRVANVTPIEAPF